MSGSNEEISLALVYLFLALIHHARYDDLTETELSMYADLDDKIGFLFRGLWRAQ